MLRLGRNADRAEAVAVRGQLAGERGVVAVLDLVRDHVGAGRWCSERPQRPRTGCSDRDAAVADVGEEHLERASDGAEPVDHYPPDVVEDATVARDAGLLAVREPRIASDLVPSAEVDGLPQRLERVRGTGRSEREAEATLGGTGDTPEVGRNFQPASGRVDVPTRDREDRDRRRQCDAAGLVTRVTDRVSAGTGRHCSRRGHGERERRACYRQHSDERLSHAVSFAFDQATDSTTLPGRRQERGPLPGPSPFRLAMQKAFTAWG